MPSGNVIVQTDRPDSPHLKSDQAIAGTAKVAELVQEGPGFDAQIIYIRIKRSWNIGWLQIDYIKSGTQAMTIELRASDGTVLATLSGSAQEGTFKSDDPINMKDFPPPEFLVLEITAGSNVFLYYSVVFLPSMSGREDPGAAAAFSVGAKTTSWRDVGLPVDDG